MTSEVFSIASRFRGPPRSGNGGYVCGRVAVHLPGCAAVRLKAPPPLESELRIEVSEAGALLMHGTNVIAEGRAAELDLAIPAIPALSEAQEAAKSFAGFKHHVFPQCFVCGPQRAPGDGLRIFPGPLANRSVVAAPWTPEASLGDGAGRLRPEFLWAALDCTSGFAVLPIPEGKAIVLGELCARIDGAVSPEDTCVVVGWPLQADGRKRLAGSAVVQARVGRSPWRARPG